MRKPVIQATLGSVMFLSTYSSSLMAQDVAFEGPYAGPYVGALEHHFYLETFEQRTGATDGRYYRDWQIGGGALGGYDLAIAERVRIGVEGSLQVGGGSPEAYLDGALYQQKSRFGYRVTGKAGLVPTDRLMVFVKGGYGGDRVSLDNRAGVVGATNWQNSFVVGGGAQVRFDPGIELRVEYEHLDNSSHGFFVALPIRF